MGTFRILRSGSFHKVKMASKLYRMMARFKKANPKFNDVVFGGHYQRQLGLLRDDYLPDCPEVNEAVRRMPLELQDQRMFRIMRALDLSGSKTVLSKEQWTTYEQDVRYIKPYLQQVLKEKKEQEEWYKQS